MKKTIAILLIAILLAALLVLASCNKQIFDFNYKFERAYIKVGDTWVDVEIEKWTDYENGEQLQLTLKDGTVMLVSSINCILYSGALPKGERP